MNEKLNVLSLREQVYQYLREQMHSARFLPGSTINIGEIAKRLGISKTPLRDALIQLEVEGFVSILPRRGVLVNELSLQDVKNAYAIAGALEASVIMDCFHLISPAHIAEMQALNERMLADIESGDFSHYYESNLAFHNVYLELSDNEALQRLLLPLKQRLYDFPRKSYIREWELRNCKEHEQFIEMIKTGQRMEAANLMKDVHWSYHVQKEYIRAFHLLATEEIAVERSTRLKAKEEPFPASLMAAEEGPVFARP